MITEQDKQTRLVNQLKANIQVCEEVLQKAEKYERLAENPDWLAVHEDVKVLIGIHRSEEETAMEGMADMNLLDKLKNLDFILQHRTRREQLQEGLREPGRIIRAAILAREKLPELKEALSKAQGETNA